MTRASPGGDSQDARTLSPSSWPGAVRSRTPSSISPLSIRRSLSLSSSLSLPLSPAFYIISMRSPGRARKSAESREECSAPDRCRPTCAPPRPRTSVHLPLSLSLCLSVSLCVRTQHDFPVPQQDPSVFLSLSSPLIRRPFQHTHTHTHAHRLIDASSSSLFSRLRLRHAVRGRASRKAARISLTKAANQPPLIDDISRRAAHAKRVGRNFGGTDGNSALAGTNPGNGTSARGTQSRRREKEWRPRDKERIYIIRDWSPARDTSFRRRRYYSPSRRGVYLSPARHDRAAAPCLRRDNANAGGERDSRAAFFLPCLPGAPDRYGRRAYAAGERARTERTHLMRDSTEATAAWHGPSTASSAASRNAPVAATMSPARAVELSERDVCTRRASCRRPFTLAHALTDHRGRHGSGRWRGSRPLAMVALLAAAGGGGARCPLVGEALDARRVRPARKTRPAPPRSSVFLGPARWRP